MKFIAAPVTVLLILMGCSMGKDAKTSSCGMPKTQAETCEGTYQGQIDPPDHEWRIYARNRQLRDKGGLGGGVDGGMYLQGAFDFQTDSTCKITKGSVILHGWRIAAGGEVKNKVINLQFEGGYGKGKVVKNVVSGSVHEGGGRDWVKGIMVGKFIPVGTK